jgi:hypothetical protein
LSRAAEPPDAEELPMGKAEVASRGRSGLAGVRVSSDARSFCLREGLVTKLAVAVETARKHFSKIGNPAVSLVQDPEIAGASYLVVEIQVGGGVKDNVTAHREFAAETSKLLGSKREIINFHYEII